MKLKQRVIVMSSLFVTMSLLFLLGVQLSWLTVSEDARPRDTIPLVEDAEPEVKVKLESEIKFRREAEEVKFKDAGKLADNDFFINNHRPPRKVLNDLAQSNKLSQSNNDKLIKGASPPLESTTYNGLRVPEDVSRKDPWKIWSEWVKADQLYPSHVFYSNEMNRILGTMATAHVTSFGLGYRGTQLKASMMLGSQQAVFKPKRYSREEVIGGDPYAGFDRHNGEIAGFHLDGILGFRIAPPVVGRRLNLTALQPVTTTKLRATYFLKGSDTCFYGECLYCRHEEAACADGEIMEGSVTLWLPKWYQLKTRRHPYQRTYRQGILARWEKDSNYCKDTVLKPSSEFYHGVLEYTDTAIYDFLMGNADRHHYEVYSKSKKHGKLMHIDNGKTFGNPLHDEVSILAPLTQCCRLRRSTWERLKSLEHSDEGTLAQILDKSLRRDPIYPILTAEHLTAIDRRLEIVMSAVSKCISNMSVDVVVTDSWG